MSQTPDQTQLKRDAFGVPGILFYVLSAQAPLTSIVGAAVVAIALGNGAGLPGAYLAVGLVIILFSVGFTAIARHLDSSGGFYAIIRAGLGERAGSGGAVVALLSYHAVQLALYGLFGASTAGLVEQHLEISTPWWLWVGLAVALVWVLGSRQVEIGTTVLAALVTIEIGLLVLFAVGVLIDRGVGAFDVGASFGFDALVAGAPGVAIMFAIASMFGFESTAIFSSEAKDPRRTVPRATYVAVVSIAVFLAVMAWVLVTYYGAADVQDAAFAALGSDPSGFAVAPLDDVLGSWAGTVAGFLLCSSLFAGVLAFHNMITRYFHAMSGAGILPAGLQRTNRHLVPSRASTLQSIVVLVVVALFTILDLDPVTTMFNWFAGLAVAALVVLYVLTSFAVIMYFRRTPTATSSWSAVVAPSLSSVLMIGVLAMVLRNFDVLTGGTGAALWLLLGAVPLAFALGWVRSGPARAGVPTGPA